MAHYARLASSDDNVTAESGMKLLSSLGLGQHADTIVGDIFRKGLSGGQKRRLSVALEALSNPDTLFLDEPTSGLDAESAFRIIKFLREYVQAAPNRRVILTIHQPSSVIWKMLHHVILLSKGKLMYGGPREEMEKFFSHAGSPCPPEFNPADHYVTVVNDEFVVGGTGDGKDTTGKAAYDEWVALGGKSIEDWTDLLKSWGGADESNVEKVHENTEMRGSIRNLNNIQSNRANFIKATSELTYRYFLNLWFNPGILGTRLVMYSMLSLLIGALFFDLGSNDSYASVQSRVALSFYCVAFFVFMSVAVMPFTVIERAIVEKEVRNEYYHPSCFQFAQAVASIPGTFVLALVTTIIVIGLTGLNSPYWYFLNMFLALNCAEALAHLVSHVVPHFIIGIALVAGIYGMFMLLQGFMIVPSEFPGWLGWSYNIAFHTYSWRTFMYNEFHGEDVTFDSIQFGTGQSILELYEIEDVNPTSDMLVLLGYAIFIHCLSFSVLHIKHTVHRNSQAI